MKNFALYCIALAGVLFTQNIFAQDTDQFLQETVSERAMNSTVDKGFYWDNGFRGRWNPFGACYRTRLYYRGVFLRERNSFWFANSAYEVGIEQAVASGSRTSAFIFVQPLIAMNFMFKIGYYKDFVKFALFDGPNGNYNTAYPPFTGLNPLTEPPVRADTDVLEIEFSPTFNFGGPVKGGVLALIYNPTLFYFHAFGLNPNQYYFHTRESVLLKTQDIFWRHDIKLGYVITGTGVAVALTGLIEHVQSIKGVFRAGVFASVSYEKAIRKAPNWIPFFRGQIGTWVFDRYLTRTVAIQLDTGIKYKF